MFIFGKTIFIKVNHEQGTENREKVDISFGKEQRNQWDS